MVIKGAARLLKTVRLSMGQVILLPYAEQDEPLLGTRPAPPGLSASLYDPEYVQNISTTAKEQLNVK